MLRNHNLQVNIKVPGRRTLHNVPKLGEGGFPYTSITDKYIQKFRSEGAPVTAAFSKVLLCEVRYTVSLTGTG